MHIEAEFFAAMQEAGITPSDGVIADGQLHRCHIEGHKSGTRNGAYVLHPEGEPQAGHSTL
jgi:putative DNA primase/helicase